MDVFMLRLFLTFMVVMNLPFSAGYVWNILLGNPELKPGGEREVENSSDSARGNRPRHLHHKLNNGTSGSRYLKKCKFSKQCDIGQFCDRHFGFCDALREEMQFCRTDQQCQQGLICMFGKCSKPAIAGQQGARCKTENDCNKDHCCARQHGEYICKRNLSLGRKCFIPKGGLDYSINEQCPCEEHLACRNIRPVSDDMNSWKTSWRSRWRCVPNHL